MPSLRAQSPRTLAALLLLLAAARATAQCPNGRPPPCQGPATTARRATLALNPRAWIVVPFTNVTKAPDVEWLRDASVNLLSMDMGRWTDVNVVPDKRVADLVRELPAAKRAESLTLNDGLAIARRAGAGMLVMGDFLKTGTGVRIAANVFDVKSGNKLRSLSEQTLAGDSLLTAFAPLARGVLAVPPPADAKTGDVGTKSLDAYQAYLLGTKALFRYDLNESRAQLLRALAIDSTFALAHLQYSLLLWWGEPPGGVGEARRHALAAQRLGTTLPKRDRMLIDARVASASEEFSRSCEISRALVAQDSTDIQAWYMLGECSYHDNTVDATPGDSTLGQFRNSWNTSIRAMTRVLELDPSYLGAFEHIFDILQSAQRSGRTCRTPAAASEPGGGDCIRWMSMVLRSKDTLVTAPSLYGANSNAVYFAQQDRARKERPRLANLELAQQLVQRWLDADRHSEGAHIAMARVHLARGNVAGAEAELHNLSPRASQENFLTIRLFMDVAAKRGRGAEARAMFDSLVKAIPDNPSIDAQRGGMELMFGRLGRFERGGAAAAARLGPQAVAYQHQVGLAMLGLPRPEMARAESAFYASMREPSCDRACRFSRLNATLAYSLHVPVGPWPALDSASQADGRLWPAAALLAHDTAQLRRAAQSHETQARENVAQSMAEAGWSMIAADAYLQLRDSAAALRATRFFVDTAMLFMPVIGGSAAGIVGTGGTVLWPRAMLLRADLAKAMGEKAEARFWYLRVLDLWANADPELQPTMERIRAALAVLDTKA